MTYKKRAGQEYRQPRKQTRSRGRLKSRSVSGMQGRASKHRKTGGVNQQFYANVMDLTRFLSKYLSGKRNIIVSTDKSRTAGYSIKRDNVQGKEFYHIKVPDWQTYNLPTSGFDKYRIYRNGLWHESMHAKYTPDMVYSHGTNDPISHDIINIIEDRRIEDLGVEEWRGYLPERIYTNAYGYALRPDIGDMWNRYTPGLDLKNPDAYTREVLSKIRHEAFLQKFITGKIKGEDKIPPAERKKIEDATEKTEKELDKLKEDRDKHVIVYTQLSRLTQEVIDDLELGGFTPQKQEGRSSWDETFTEQYARDQNAKQKKVKKDMKEFFEEKKEEAKPSKTRGKGKNETPSEPAKPTKDKPEITEEDVEQAIEGSEQIAKEYQQASKEEVDQLTPMFSPVASAVSPGMYKDQKFITQMNTALKEWKTGRKDVVGSTGSRLSIPDYIRHKEEPFVTRIKKSARGRKILVITDFSGSMEPRQEEYKKALISTMEVLDGIGGKTALFGFGGEKGGTGYFFFKVKRFEEPRWKPNHASKTAALEADYPSTPTSDAYRGLEPYVRKHRPDVTITITDGSPDNPNETAEMVKKLKKNTRMVAFGIGHDAETARYMEQKLRDFGYHKVFSVDSVDKIPRKLVNLIAPTR